MIRTHISLIFPQHFPDILWTYPWHFPDLSLNSSQISLEFLQANALKYSYYIPVASLTNLQHILKHFLGIILIITWNFSNISPTSPLHITDSSQSSLTPLCHFYIIFLTSPRYFRDTSLIYPHNSHPPLWNLPDVHITNIPFGKRPKKKSQHVNFFRKGGGGETQKFK